MDELNEERQAEPTSRALVASADPLALVDDLESQAIIESLAGNVSETWVYSIPQGESGRVTGLSAVGVDQAARYMATKGEALRIIDCHIEYEDEREARFFAVAGRYAVNAEGRHVLLDTATGAKRQPKYMKLRSGGERFNDAWYEIGNTKACRNAKAKLLADEVRQYIIAEALKAGGGRVRPVAPVAPASRAAPRPTEPQRAQRQRRDDAAGGDSGGSVELRVRGECSRCDVVMPAGSEAVIENGRPHHPDGACPPTPPLVEPDDPGPSDAGAQQEALPTP